MQDFEFWKKNITQSLMKKLPGIDAHRRMAPRSLGINFRDFTPGPRARKSAVLIPISNIKNEARILFTLRSSKLKSHRNQISFPGGKQEPNESLLTTALRETQEETGISPEFVNVVGPLSDLFVSPSNSLISPFVGFIDPLPPLVANPDEVEEIFFVSLESFMLNGQVKTTKRKIGTVEADVPYWEVHSKTILWGATAMILSEFFSLLENNS